MKLILCSGLALGLSVVLWFPGQARSADPVDGKAMDAKMMEHCRAMKEQHQKMQADMDSQAVQLRDQIEKMNRAPREERMELLAAVVTDMAEQQANLNSRRSKLMNGMMTHMMEHMQMGKDSMTQCPMMPAKDAKAGDVHKH
jgi:TolA-binding protein